MKKKRWLALLLTGVMVLSVSIFTYATEAEPDDSETLAGETLEETAGLPADSESATESSEFAEESTEAAEKLAEGLSEAAEEVSLEAVPYSEESSSDVAEVDGIRYTDLRDAISNAQGKTITLLKDVDLGTDRYLFIGKSSRDSKLADHAYTLDLGGHTLTGTICLLSADLKVKNGTIKYPSDSAIIVYAYGYDFKDYNKLTIEKDAAIIGSPAILQYFKYAGNKNGTEAKNFGSTTDIYGTLNGGVFVQGLVQTDLETAQKPCGINVHSGANIESTNGCGISINGAAIVNIEEGATVKGLTGVEVRAGKLNVTGGTITGTADKLEVKANGSGSATVGAGIAVAQHGTKLPTIVNISGGTISGAAALNESNPEGNFAVDLEKVEIHISGGDFKATDPTAPAVKSEDKKNFVSGGSFSSKVPDDFCAEDFQPTKQRADGTYSVENEKNGHAYDESTWQYDETSHYHLCMICEEEKTGIEEHTYEWVEDQAPTCVVNGRKHRECTVCDYREADVEIPATGHSAGTEWKSDPDGHWYECVKGCGEKLNQAVHTFKWVVDQEASASKKGSKHEECTVCGYKKAVVEIPAETKPAETKPAGQPAGTKAPGKTEAPVTGENRNPGVAASAMLLSLLGIAVLKLTREKKRG